MRRFLQVQVLQEQQVLMEIMVLLQQPLESQVVEVPQAQLVPAIHNLHMVDKQVLVVLEVQVVQVEQVVPLE